MHKVDHSISLKNGRGGKTLKIYTLISYNYGAMLEKGSDNPVY